VSRNNTRQSSLCRVSPRRHLAKNSKIFFVECRPGDTRQRRLCRVPPIWHSAKRILKLKKYLPSARSWALGKALVHSVWSVLLLPHSLTLSLCRAHCSMLPPCPPCPRPRSPLCPPCPRRPAAPSCPRPPAAPPIAHSPARRQSAHRESARGRPQTPAPLAPPATRRLARDQTSKVISCFRFVIL
jgi:hypothetical protein